MGEAGKKENKHRRLWVILTIFIVVMMVAWCIVVYSMILKPIKSAISNPVTEDSNTKEEKRKQEVLAYLKERYDEEFEIASYRGMSYAYDYVKMYAYPKGYSDEAHQFQIQGRLNEDRKMEYCDSYVMVKLTDDYAACVDEIIDEYFDDYKFYLEFYSEWITSNLPPDTTVEDLLELSANVDYPMPELHILLKSSQMEHFTDDNVMAMCKKLAVWGYRGPINTRCYDDDQYYEKKNNENKRECSSVEELHRKYHVIFIRDENNIDYR